MLVILQPALHDTAIPSPVDVQGFEVIPETVVPEPEENPLAPYSISHSVSEPPAVHPTTTDVLKIFAVETVKSVGVGQDAAAPTVNV